MPTPPDDHRLCVKFGDEKTGLIREVGRRRQAAKTTERKAASRGGTDLHVSGFAAEAALAEALGVKPDLSVRPDGGGEESLRALGFTFDTKWRGRSTRDLAYWPGEVPGVDILVLATGDLPTLWLQGWIRADAFRRHSEPTEFGKKGKRWVMGPTDLFPMHELYATVETDPPAPVRAMQPEGHPLRPQSKPMFDDA